VANQTVVRGRVTPVPVTLADWVFARSDVVMIGAFRPAAEVGFYAAALGLAATVELLMNAVIAVVAPDFAHLHAGGRASELQRTVTNATRLMFFAVVPFVLIMIVFGKPLLLLFGKSFPAAHTALSLLALAYLVNSFAGPLGLLLSQTGGHAAFAKVIIVTSAISMAVEVWLVASYGITGAASAKLIAAILKSSALSIVVAMKTGIMPTIIGPRVRHLAAATDPTAEGTH
jgi:O-antigen/teichoic acid export membrane protein